MLCIAVCCTTLPDYFVEEVVRRCRSLLKYRSADNVSPAVLASQFAFTKVPKPTAWKTSRSLDAGTNSWYDPREMRAWWAAHQAEKAARS